MIMTEVQKIPSSPSQLNAGRTASAIAANVVEDYREAIGIREAANIEDDSAPSSNTASKINLSAGDEDEDTSLDGSADGDNARKRTRESEMSPADLLEERRSKNRRSAHQSRLRKRRQLVYFEQQVHLLMDENQKLVTANEAMTNELETIRHENAQLRVMHQEAVQIAHALRLTQGGSGQDAARIAQALRLAQPGGGGQEAARIARALRLVQQGAGDQGAARIAQALRLAQHDGEDEATRIARALRLAQGGGNPAMFRRF